MEKMKKSYLNYDTLGELYVTLCQKTPKGHWTGKDMEYIDVAKYTPDKLYIREKTLEEMAEVDEPWGM